MLAATVGAVPVQAGGFFVTIGFFLLVLAAVALSKSVVVVENGRPEALFVLGEFRAVLAPGLNFVPPFVSETHPVDQETATVDMGDRRIDVPGEYRDALDAHADPAVLGDDEPPTPSGGVVSGPSRDLERDRATETESTSDDRA